MESKCHFSSVFLANVIKSISNITIAEGIYITITGVNNIDGTNNNKSVNPSITIPYGGFRLDDLAGKGIFVLMFNQNCSLVYIPHVCHFVSLLMTNHLLQNFLRLRSVRFSV